MGEQEETEEIWVRYTDSALLLGPPDPVPLEPWHLKVATFPDVVPLTACGVDLDQGETETHEGIPEISPHGGEAEPRRLCLVCYQVHLARIGVDISDDPISEDYHPSSSSIRAENEAVEASGIERRWRTKTAFERILEEGLQPFGPKAPDHASCGNECPACFRTLEAGQYTTLVPLGPGGSSEDRMKALEGKPYNAVAVEVHWSCATGLPDHLAAAFIAYMDERESETVRRA